MNERSRHCRCGWSGLLYLLCGVVLRGTFLLLDDLKDRLKPFRIDLTEGPGGEVADFGSPEGADRVEFLLDLLRERPIFLHEVSRVHPEHFPQRPEQFLVGTHPDVGCFQVVPFSP